MGAVMMGLAMGLYVPVLLTSCNSEAARKVTLSAQATKASFAPFTSPSPSPSPSTTEGFHPAAVCDKTGQGPTIGWLFHLTGKNYDLCEAEFNQLLPEAEKASYEKLLAEAVEKCEKFASNVAKKREGWRKLLLAKAKRDRRQARQ